MSNGYAVRTCKRYAHGRAQSGRRAAVAFQRVGFAHKAQRLRAVSQGCRSGRAGRAAQLIEDLTGSADTATYAHQRVMNGRARACKKAPAEWTKPRAIKAWSRRETDAGQAEDERTTRAALKRRLGGDSSGAW